jgi:hypothetical protein
MKSQTWQFLKLFIAVVISLNLLVGVALLGSWLSSRHQVANSAAPAAATGQ